MENSSRRRVAQRHIPNPSRRSVLQLVVGAPVALLPCASIAPRPLHSAIIPPTMTGYYAYLLREAAAIEEAYGLQSADHDTACAGLARGEAMRQGSTIEQRYEWLSHFADTRALFARPKAEA